MKNIPQGGASRDAQILGGLSGVKRVDNEDVEVSLRYADTICARIWNGSSWHDPTHRRSCGSRTNAVHVLNFHIWFFSYCCTYFEGDMASVYVLAIVDKMRTTCVYLSPMHGHTCNYSCQPLVLLSPFEPYEWYPPQHILAVACNIPNMKPPIPPRVLCLQQ